MIDVARWPEEADWRADVVDRTLARRELIEHDASRRVVAAGIELVDQIGADFTVQDVSELAGVSRRKFYDLFPSKDDLYLAMFAEVNVRAVAARRAVVAAAGGDSAERLRRCLVHAFDERWRGDRFLRGMAQLEARVVSSRVDGLVDSARPWIDYLTELVADCRADGRITSVIDDRRIATWLQRAVRMRLIHDRVSDDPGIPPDEPAPHELIDLLLDGAFGGGGAQS